MINMENYQSYLYLYQEGELDSSTCLEVERFLLEHPDIREEMEAYYDPTLVVTAEPPSAQPQHKKYTWRWVAAACVVLAMGWGVYMVFPSQTKDGITVAQSTKPATTLEPVEEHDTTENTTPIDQAPSAPLATNHAKNPSSASLAVAKTPIDENLTAHANQLPAVLSTATEEADATLIDRQPHHLPSTLESRKLAQVNEVILVDNLAEVIPTQTKAEEPSLLLQMAHNIRKNLDQTKQDIHDIIYNGLLSPRESQELADASIMTE